MGGSRSARRTVLGALLVHGVLAALGLSAGDGAWASSSVIDGKQNCTGINCGAREISGTLLNVGTEAGEGNTWTYQVFAQEGDCLRLDVTAANKDLVMMVVDPSQAKFLNDDRGIGQLNPLVQVRPVLRDGYATIVLALWDPDDTGNANFVLRYGRYDATTDGQTPNPNCAEPTPAFGDGSNFTGPYALQNWMSSGIEGGTTAITPSTGSSPSAEFSYNVFLGNPGPGVDFRTATFSAIAAASGPVTFDYEYTGFHAFCCPAEKIFQVYADEPGTRSEFTIVSGATNGEFSDSGTVELVLTEGFGFGFIVGGSNFDANSRLQGTLRITNFQAPVGVRQSNSPGAKP